MAALGNHHKKMLSGLAEERVELRKDFDERRRKLEQEFEVARNQSESEAKEEKTKFKHPKEKEELHLRGKEILLEKREQELDDRQHMHARRELRQQITENFKSKIGEPVVSERESGMRWAVFLLTIITGLGIGYFRVENSHDLVNIEKKNELPTWLLIGCILGGIIPLFLTVGFIAYAINGLRVIYLDEVRTERHSE